MRAVVQRVVNASVAVDGATISQIGRGLMILVGVERNDTQDDAAWIIKKVLSAKLWDGDTDGAWRRNVVDIDGEVLCVSQFTLFANFKGARPDFHESMGTAAGKAAYAAFLDAMGKAYRPERIKDGQFGAMMQVSLTNDGPVTVLFDSRERRSRSGATSASASASGASTPTAQPQGQGQPQKPPKGSAEAAAIAKAKNEARAAKKAEWEARKAAAEHEPPAGAAGEGA